MKMSIREFNDVPETEWDDFVLHNSMGSAHFLYALVNRDWKMASRNLSFVIDEDGVSCGGGGNNILCAFQLNLAECRLTLHGFSPRAIMRYLFHLAMRIIGHEPKHFLYSHFGFVLRDGLTKRQMRQVKEFLNEKLDAIIAQYHIQTLSLEFSPLSPALQPGVCPLENPCVHLGFSPTVRYTYMVDLSKSDEAMLADCEETTRQAIRKIEKSGEYAIEEDLGSDAEFQRYVNLHLETYARTGGTPKPESYHRLLHGDLARKGVCKIFWLKELATGEYVADITVLISGNMAYYYWGCSADNKVVGINKYLLFKVMMEVRAMFRSKGMVNAYFETGGARPAVRGGKGKGLDAYKKSFGTFMHPIWGGVYEQRI